MKIIRLLPFLLFLGTLLSGCKTTQIVETVPQVKETVTKPTCELHGHVMLPESWINNDTGIMRENISTIIKKVAEANYNAVFFCVRERAETYFPSPIEPWSEKLEFGAPGLDPLRLAIETAHKHNLKIYAEVDLLELGEEDHPPDNPDHLYYKHGPGASLDSGWIILNHEGGSFTTNGNLLLNPSLPQVKTYLKNVILNLIINYDIDGLNLNLTGFSPDLFSNDTFSRKKFKQDSLQLSITRKDWAKERLTDLIEDIVVEAMLVKPYLVNSILFSGENEYQNIINCLEEGIVDFIIPGIDIDINNPDQQLQDFWDENQKKNEIPANVFPMFSLKEACDNEEIISRLFNLIKENGGRGMVLVPEYSQSGSALSDSLFYHYTDEINFPDSLKQVTPGQVVGLNVSALFNNNHSGQTIYINQRTKNKITDSEGYIGFITSHPDTIELGISNKSVFLPTGRWSIPYKYAVQPDNKTIRKSPWVEFRRMPKKFTDIPEYDLLCKTNYPASVWINDDPVKIYKTGVFFNKITLNDGKNRVRASVLTQDSLSVFYEREFIYEAVDKTRLPFPLWIDDKSVEPGYDLELLPDDIVRISFHGSLGQDGYVAVNPGGKYVDCSRKDYEDYSLYQAELPLRRFDSGNSYSITLGLTSSADTPEIMSYKFDLPNNIKVREADDFPLVKVINEHSRLTYNLGPIRLGGPIRSEFGPGITMKTNGKIGENYRIHLNRIENAMIHQNDVELLPPETVQPTYFITNMSCAPSRGADVLSIPYLEPIPYEVYPDPDQNRIVVTLFGAKTSSTWITHHKGRKIIDKVTWKQTTPETYEVYVNLKTSNIWGYDIRRDGNRLLLFIKYPPKYNLDNKKPLAGLKIAIEAGHGGDNTGAIGLSGLQEKDINLDLSLLLGELCKSMGAEILQVRESDKDMSLIEKRDIAQSSDADLLISIHANAAGRGYLRVPGTSTYYNNPFWAPLAESIYNRLLELELDEFGVIGSFNYTVIRVSQMPSILVEQAFMSHAEDEEKLADPQFRQQMAQKIYEGILDYLRFMEE